MTTDVAEPTMQLANGPSDFDVACYRQAAFIRAFEATALSLTQTKPPVIEGSIHLCAGQEIVPVAAMAALQTT